MINMPLPTHHHGPLGLISFPLAKIKKKTKEKKQVKSHLLLWQGLLMWASRCCVFSTCQLCSPAIFSHSQTLDISPGKFPSCPWPIADITVGAQLTTQPVLLHLQSHLLMAPNLLIFTARAWKTQFFSITVKSFLLFLMQLDIFP